MAQNKKLYYWLGSVLHNCIAHPLLPFLPTSWGTWFHDQTAQWLEPEPIVRQSEYTIGPPKSEASILTITELRKIFQETYLDN